jgi:DNA-binding CsgD family transcriptional regulator
MLAGRRDETIAVCEDAIRVAQLVDEPMIEGHARNSLGTVLAGVGRTEEGLNELHRARELALKTSSWQDVARAAVNEGGALQTLGRHEEALAMSLEGAELAHGHGIDRSFGAFLRLNANESLWALGRWDEFEEQLREVEIIDPIGFDQWRVGRQRCMLAIARGRFDAARSSIADVRRLLEGSGDVHDHLALEELEIALDSWQGNVGEAVQAAVAALAMPVGTVSLCSDASVEVLIDGLAAGATAARRETDEVTRKQTIGLVRRLATECESWRDLDRWFGGLPGDFDATLLLVAAEVARAEGRDTVEQWVEVAAAWTEFGARPREAYARLRAAEAGVRDGDRAAAAAQARVAYELTERMGWIVVRNAVAQLARRGRLDVHVPDDVAPTAAERYGLTARELEVLALVAEGHTNRQIASELFISSKTASVHVSNILGKLEVANRGEAAALARRLDLVSNAP